MCLVTCAGTKNKSTDAVSASVPHAPD